MQTVKPRVSHDDEKATIKQLSNKLNQYMQVIENQQQTILCLKRRLASAEEYCNHRKGDEDAEVWFWQGEGNDHPESMVNSLTVVIRAEDLRKVISQTSGTPYEDQQKITALSQAVHFYATQSKYTGSWRAGDGFHVMEDKGRVARNALEVVRRGQQL